MVADVTSSQHCPPPCPTLSVHNVSVAIGEQFLLPPTSLAVDAGEAAILRGPNGAGKSTLLRVLAGLQKPSSGQVHLAGKPLETRNRDFRRSVAAMIGLPPLSSDLTVQDHVLMVALSWYDTHTQALAAAEDVTASLGIDHLAERFPHEASSGQTQLCALALTLVRPFSILLLDEPEQRLDQNHIEKVATVLSAHQERGAAVVLATHSDVLADRLDGKVHDIGQETTGV